MTQEGENGGPFYEHKTVIVDPGQTPLRLDKFLGDRLMNVSRNKIQYGLKSAAITVNEKSVKASYKVQPGDRIDIVGFERCQKVAIGDVLDLALACPEILGDEQRAEGDQHVPEIETRLLVHRSRPVGGIQRPAKIGARP